MHTTRNPLTDAELRALIARRVLPAGTHTAPRAEASAVRFARLSEPAQTIAVRPTAAWQQDAPHRWLDTDRAALDDAATRSTEGCAATTTQPGALPRDDAGIYHAFDVRVEPWHLPHTAHRANDAPARWEARPVRPPTPIATDAEARALRGERAPVIAFPARPAPPNRPPRPGAARQRARDAWRPTDPGRITRAADALTRLAMRVPAGWLAIAAWLAAFGLGIALSHLWPWGWALPAGQ